jgi:hypothetical protein
MRAALCLALVAAPALAGAYPQFQLTTGSVRCNQCHFAPAGGGLLNGYGRSEAGDTISMTGDGGFLHGAVALPSWIAVGGDVRLAALVHDEDAPRGADTIFIPMQADLYLRAAVSSVSAHVTVGFRGGARPKDHPSSSRFISREHYLMGRQGRWYARAGRFFAPYGLRLAEHTAYVRRFMGFNLLEETYGVSGGFLSDRWELHLTAFTPDFVRDAVGQPGSGGALLYERRAGDTAAYGVQGKVTASEHDLRATGGAIGKLYLAGPRLQLLAEANVVYQSFDDVDAPRAQLTAYLGATWFPVRGLMTQLALERWDEDLDVKGVARSAASAQVQWFPVAHIEVSLWGRLAMLGSGEEDGPLAKTLLAQLHYYL